MLVEGGVKLNVIMTQRQSQCQHDLTSCCSWSPDVTIGGYIWSSCALHLKSWPYSSSSVHIIWKDDLILLLATRCHYQGVHLIFMCTSSENMSSFWVWVLHHRGLFYKRPTRVFSAKVGNCQAVSGVPPLETVHCQDWQQSPQLPHDYT